MPCSGKAPTHWQAATRPPRTAPRVSPVLAAASALCAGPEASFTLPLQDTTASLREKGGATPSADPLVRLLAGASA
jgi:hypothetical protein